MILTYFTMIPTEASDTDAAERGYSIHAFSSIVTVIRITIVDVCSTIILFCIIIIILFVPQVLYRLQNEEKQNNMTLYNHTDDIKSSTEPQCNRNGSTFCNYKDGGKTEI